ncbi:MAG: ArsC family reductase [Gammaproteobacteria bacterium]
MITIYGISNCDTIKKTRAWLKDAGVPHDFHDYRKDGITESLVETFLARFTLEELINRRGTTWRKLPETVREALTPESAVTVMLENPALIRRPILTDGNHWLLGFDPQAIQQTLTS